MNVIERIMAVVLIAAIILSCYLTYHGIVRLERWKAYATSQGCSFVARAKLDHKIIINCNGTESVEDTRTYGIP